MKHIQQIGVDEERLEKIEPLALALNEAKIPDQDLPAYIERQGSLNKAGISLSIFTEMLEKVKVVTKEDHGAKLLNLLSEYGGLAGVISEYQDKKQVLTKEVGDLEQKVKTKDKLTGEIKIQTDVKANLEANIAQLQKDKSELGNVTGLLQVAQVAYYNLNEDKANLEKEITGVQATRDSLENEIKTKEQKVSDFSVLESKREKLLNDISEMEGRVNKEKKRWQVFEGFLGMVQASSKEELKKSIEILPALLEELDEKKYSPEFLKDLILKELAGPTLQVWRCNECQARFWIDKPLPSGELQCPNGGWPHKVVIDKDASEILNEALPKSKYKIGIGVTATSPSAKQPPTPKAKDNG